MSDRPCLDSSTGGQERSWGWEICVTSEPPVIHQNTTKTEKSFGVHLQVNPAQAAILKTNGGGEIAAGSGNNVMSF